MTVLTRGSRPRRGGRRPGWVLLTALLVLAIAASSALVFTNRVELLKLAVILSLWAAVAAAFVSVIYRRQSDIDQAKARDLKLVYDLQLDREISARREYELTLETQLRRELAAELQAQQSDEVAALRAELAALRANLEILFDTDLAHRPALETERTTVRAYSDWAREEPAGRLVASRYDATGPEDGDDDSAIIDVAAEPHSPEGDWAPVHDTAGGATNRAGRPEPVPGAHSAAHSATSDATSDATPDATPGATPDAGQSAPPRRRRRRYADDEPAADDAAAAGGTSQEPAGRSATANWVTDPQPGWRPSPAPSDRRAAQPESAQQPTPPAEPARTPPPAPEGGRRRRADQDVEFPWLPPQQPHTESEPVRPTRSARYAEPAQTAEPGDTAGAGQWRPAPSEGRWAPPGTPGSNWVAPVDEGAPARAGDTAPDHAEDRGPDHAQDRAEPTFGEREEPIAPVPEPAPQPTPQPGPAPSPDPARAAQPASERTPEPPREYVGRRRKPEPDTPPAPEPAAPSSPPEPPRGRHYAPGAATGPDVSGVPTFGPVPPPPRPDSPADSRPAGSQPAGSRPAGTPVPRSRRRAAERDESGQHTGGQSVAELLARLQANGTATGRRSRRNRDDDDIAPRHEG